MKLFEELKKDNYTKEEVQEMLDERDVIISQEKVLKEYQVNCTWKAIPRLINLHQFESLDSMKQKINNYLEGIFDDVPKPKSKLSTESSD
ncbi:MAG: hypothetical protein CMI54_04150 [Parcubacteria group bacterium]|jgi:galactitol-specific phosphotransferase system IIB component|nr:hypothetical protein [Parcubacteria group bacterium]|tara:strand:+ start:668 stop:937 length:270 start_codon:yes stop_codon:yes gene_type:complete